MFGNFVRRQVTKGRLAPGTRKGKNVRRIDLLGYSHSVKYDPAVHTEFDLAEAIDQLFNDVYYDLGSCCDPACPAGCKPDEDYTEPKRPPNEDIRCFAFRDFLGDKLCDFGVPEQVREDAKKWVLAGAKKPWRRHSMERETFKFRDYTK